MNLHPGKHKNAAKVVSHSGKVLKWLGFDSLLIETIAVRLDHLTQMHAVDFGSISSVAIFSKDYGVYAGLRAMLEAAGADVLITMDFSLTTDNGVVFVDLDSLGGAHLLYDFLREFRNKFPSRRVILISAEFGSDDFSMERLALCDASLRIPFSFYRVEMAIAEAEVNNAEWQNRRSLAVGCAKFCEL